MSLSTDWLGPVSLALVAGCGAAPSGQAVKTYVAHVHEGRLDRAYGMITEARREELTLEQWKSTMSTEALMDAQDASIHGIRSFSPGGTCVYADLDFVSRNDQGPYGHYFFYLQDTPSGYRVQDVLTYDRISGEGLVKVSHFDESREPFPCSSTRP